ncbi:MAG: immunoglobulin-like domain-containing protein [Gemmatimonadota bacterium]
MKSKRHSTPARAGRALLPSALLIVLLTAAGVWGASPDWSVNPAAYAKQMSVMGALLVDYEAAGPGNRVAAFSGGTCRGVAEPVQIGGTWVYFLTVYGSPGDTSVRFRAYVAAEDAVLEVLETLPFASGAIHGSPFAPFQWNAILRYDYPPEVGDIPGQTIEIGDSFSGVRLDDYLTSQDGDAVTWTGSGGGFLDVLIDGDNVARVVAPAGWLGSETVVFTAVEQTEGGKAGSTAAVFTVRGIDHPPAVSGIGDQRIGPEGAFRSFDLDDHLTEADGDAVAWSYWFVAGDGGQAAPGWSVDPAEYSGSMSVIARAAVRGRWADTQDYLLGAFAGDQCRGVARPMALAGSHVFWMSVYGRPGDGALTFRLYDPVAREVVEVYGSIDYAHGGRSGTPDAPLSLRAGPIVLEIGEGNVVTPILVERGREVSEEIVFEARDTGTLHEFAATAGVRLSYSLLNAPPVAHAGDDIVVPCLSPTATPVTLDGTGSADPDGDPLSFRWLEGGRIIATGARPTVELSLGSHPIALVVNDGQVDSEPDEVVVQVVDVTAPVMVLVGDPTLYLELGTPYAEPGVTAIDACDGDLSQAVTRSGEVNEQVEGTYAISYSVTDAAGNAASLERAVRVVVTPNSYGLVATRSLEIQERATVHSGFVGVVEYGRRPYPPGDAELVAGPRAQTAAGVRVTAPPRAAEERNEHRRPPGLRRAAVRRPAGAHRDAAAGGAGPLAALRRLRAARLPDRRAGSRGRYGGNEQEGGARPGSWSLRGDPGADAGHAGAHGR